METGLVAAQRLQQRHRWPFARFLRTLYGKASHGVGCQQLIEGTEDAERQEQRREDCAKSVEKYHFYRDGALNLVKQNKRTISGVGCCGDWGSNHQMLHIV